MAMKMKLLLAGSFFFIIKVNGQWNTDTLLRNPICTAANQQISPQLCTDGFKGAIITWSDMRNNPPEVYAQRIDSNGIIKWTNNGLIATPGAPYVLPAYPASDNNGGAIIAYEVTVPGGETHIHAQRLDANGNAMWGTNGIRLDTISTSRLGNNVAQVITEDGNGGAFVTWSHAFFGTDEIRIQHLDHNGNLLLGPQGLAVSNNTMTHYSSRIINTGNNTCIIAYEQQGNLFMQRISAAGTKMWGVNDVQITNSIRSLTANVHYMATTSAKNIVVAWEDIRNATSDIYAQKIDTNGILKWAVNGLVVDNSPLFTSLPELVADNNDGVYIGYGFTLAFVQHLDLNGQLLWGAGGKNVSASGNQTAQHIWSDGNNGMVISWEDKNTGPTQRLYAQHYDSTGTALWRPNGLPLAVTGNNGINANNRTMGLKSGRAIAVWEDYRNGVGNADIYTARFGNNAVLNPGFTTVNSCFGDSTQFNDITTSTASTVNYWRWNFGDGSPVGTIKNPKHKYAATGNYMVTLTLMDDEFNYRVISQPIVISNKPVVNIGNDTTLCSGNSILLNAGNSGSQFLWSTAATTQTISVNTTGSYWVKVTNGGCSASDTMMLAIQSLPIVNIGSDTAICAGNSIVLNAGNTGAQYLWSTTATTQSISVNTANTYWVKVANGNCVASDTMLLSIKPLPQASFTYIVNFLSVNFINNSTNANSYNWSFGDGTTNNNPSPAHLYANSGTYSVKLIATNGCKPDSSIQIINVTKPGTPVDSCGPGLSIKLFPNPVHNILSIHFFTPVAIAVTVRIINEPGQVMHRYEFSTVKCRDIKQIDMSAFAAGIYFLEFTSNGKKTLRKIMRQ